MRKTKKFENIKRSYFLPSIIFLIIIAMVSIITYRKADVKRLIDERITKNTVKNINKKENYGVINITKDDPLLGSASAKLSIIIFGDFLCPYCAAFSGKSLKLVEMMKKTDKLWQPPFPALISDYVNTGKAKVIWKDLPYHGDEAILVHSAARCAFEQNKFWQYHDQIFTQHDNIKDQTFSSPNLIILAEKTNLDINNFTKCLEGEKNKIFLQKALENASDLKIYQTPSVFINGILITGAKSYTRIRQIVEEQLAQ